MHDHVHGLSARCTLSSMRVTMSSREKGMEESSSSRKEWLAAVLLSTINCFMRCRTSWDTVSVPYLEMEGCGSAKAAHSVSPGAGSRGRFAGQ